MAAQYVWIGESGVQLRSQAITLTGPISDASKLPKWNYDSSSPNLAPREDSEVILHPQAIFKDPFGRGNDILVMCDAYTPAGVPITTNKRYAAAKIFSHPDVIAEEPRYTIQQEYTLLQPDVEWPIGWAVGGYPGPLGPYYCGVGADKAFGRVIADSHYKACLYAGIKIDGIEGGVVPGEWKFQVGPARGISAGDELWVARYILGRITEIAGVVLALDPQPIQGDTNTGSRTNCSTESMRKDGGHEAIRKAIERIGQRGKEQICADFFTGCHETADINTFLWGLTSGGASIGVRRDIEEAGNGYLEYRRPASKMDPYVVTSLIAETTILWKPWYLLAFEQAWRGIVG